LDGIVVAEAVEHNNLFGPAQSLERPRDVRRFVVREDQWCYFSEHWA